MARVVLPEFLQLRLGTLDDAHAAGRYAAVEAEFEAQLRQREHDIREPGIPVSLRWVANPLLGFPRTPFEVWRRARKEEPTRPLTGGGTRVAPTVVALPTPVIEIRFAAQVGAGQVLVVEALGAGAKVLPGQRLTFGVNRTGRFRGPGITALRLLGQGQIGSIATLVQADWANLPDWVRIETVGFPFEPGQLPAAAYEPGKQGWESPSLTGPDATLLRMGVARALQLDPPAPGGGLVAPAWPFPDPAAFLDVLRTGPLADIEQCLTGTDDGDPELLQALHELTRSVPGIHQPGLPTGPDPAELTLATTAYVALAVQDGPVALGLGFGTTDFPPQGSFAPQLDDMPPGTSISRDEYLVTARVRLWTGTELEVAAVGHRVPGPPPLAGLAAEQTFRNRATTRDEPESVAVRLGWTAPLLPVGAGLLARRASDPTVLVNTPRPAGSGGFQPYLTEHRVAADGLPPADLRPGVTLPEEPAPLAGAQVTTYAAAPVDVHGRWGPWRLTTHTATARPVQLPGLHEVVLTPPDPLPATAPVAAGATLTVDVSWDWADRSPDRIEVSGAFVAPGPPPASVTGFQPDSAAAPLVEPVTIGFTATDELSIRQPAPQSTTVVEVAETDGGPGGPPLPGSAGSQVRRYRLTVPVMSLLFATAAELTFAVSARAAERVRPGPDQLSAAVDPRTTTVANPFPAPPPPLPGDDVLWTAQPDAAGRARTVLSWPPVAGASGYVVWEATEAALFDAVTGGGSPATGVPIRTRAQDLRIRVADNQAASLGTFSRLTERPLTATSIELVLPAAADTLFAYRVSSITAQNVESPRSAEIVLVGVPRRDVPGTPRMEARVEPGADTATLTVVAGGGVAPARLRVHRVRREALADAIGTMGPPVLEVAVAALPTVAVPTLSGPAESGWALTDAVTPGWSPYLYRCVAVGRDAPDDGTRAGESPPSGVVRVLVAPPLPPLLGSIVRTSGPAGTLLRFDTDLPATPTRAGRGTLTVAAVDGGTRTVLATLEPATIETGPPPAVIGAAGTTVVATRRPPVAGVIDVSVLVPSDVTGALVLTATDPLGRSTTVEPG
jgi:hypothetical protein